MRSEKICKGKIMSVSYKKLFKLMIDKDIKKKELKVMASIGNTNTDYKNMHSVV